jgi:hypothetical protein
MLSDESLPDNRQNTDSMGGWLQLPRDSDTVVLVERGVCRSPSSISDVAILSGSFNPIHEGHRQLRQAAERFLNRRVYYELSILNVDKPDLAADEVTARVERIADAPVLLTQAARFVEKARLFPGCWFVVGFDTAERLLQPAYYADDIDLRDAAMDQLRISGTRFLVGGRLDSVQPGGEFRNGNNLELVPDLNSMFVSLPEAAFRVDVSSTAIRHRENRPG